YPFWVRYPEKRTPGMCSASWCKEPATMNHIDTELCDAHWELYCEAPMEKPELPGQPTQAATYHQPAIGDHDPRCRLVTGRVDSTYCEDCRRWDQLLASGEPFCACGYIVSRCVGSRRGCVKGPSIDPVSLTNEEEP